MKLADWAKKRDNAVKKGSVRAQFLARKKARMQADTGVEDATTDTVDSQKLEAERLRFVAELEAEEYVSVNDKASVPKRKNRSQCHL